MSNKSIAIINKATNYSHLVVPLAAVIILLVLLVPLPAILLDILISFNLMISVIVLLVSMYVLEPIEFTAFPTLLLLTTLYRLALNVATSRLILLNGDMGEGAAGAVIKAFGEFVIGGNYIVGMVIFIILLVIQFVVVNHGAVRSSEVMARFTLDAMPGKQMAVDADLAAGIIDEHQAKKRREEISQSSEFHGAMDGAIRFTQRDAVASILITVINIVGGFAVGILQHDLPIAEAAKTYTILTVGDGVAAAVPSLFVSVAAAVVTTRAVRQSNMGSVVSAQLLVNPQPIFITAGVLAFLGLMPGMPHIPFILLALTTATIGYFSQQYQQNILAEEKLAVTQNTESEISPAIESTESLLKLDVLALEVGYGLISLVSTNNSFIGRIKEIRRQIALDLGVVVPSVHVRDNLQLAPKEYSILLKGNRIAYAEIKPDSFMAIDPGIVREKIEGVETKDPAFGMPAIWISNEMREKAITSGYTVVDPVTVICTHLSEIIKENCFELLGRQETRALLDELGKTHPKTVEETTPKIVSLGEVQRVLQNLLRERIPIRDLITILESIADAGTLTHDVNLLTESARVALSRTICNRLSNENNELVVITLDPVFEHQLAEKLGLIGTVKSVIEPDFARSLLEKIEVTIESALLSQPILLCSALLRPHLKKLTARFLPNLSVIAHSEITATVKLVSVGVIK